MKRLINILLIIMALSLVSCDRTRQDTRKGNRAYKNKDYEAAEKHYKDALKEDSTFSVAQYNMGNALMQKSGHDYASAIKYYNKYLSNKIGDSRKDSLNFSRAIYNRGNAHFAISQMDKGSEDGMKHLKSAADDYKNAIMLNPQDSNAKYNYALCMYLMKNNNNPDNNNNNNNNNNNSSSEMNQMLEAMKNNEKNIISRVKKEEKNAKPQKNEKDW